MLRILEKIDDVVMGAIFVPIARVAQRLDISPQRLAWVSVGALITLYILDLYFTQEPWYLKWFDYGMAPTFLIIYGRFLNMADQMAKGIVPRNRGWFSYLRFARLAFDFVILLLLYRTWQTLVWTFTESQMVATWAAFHFLGLILPPDYSAEELRSGVRLKL